MFGAAGAHSDMLGRVWRPVWACLRVFEKMFVRVLGTNECVLTSGMDRPSL